MNCEHCQELLPARERGELVPELESALVSHLRGCDDCARVDAELRELNALLDAEVTPSSALRRKVLASLELEAAQRAPSATPLRLWFAKLWPSQPLSAFSYSLALVLCGVFGGQMLPGGAGAGMADIPAERLYQLCAVPPPPAPNIL